MIEWEEGVHVTAAGKKCREWHAVDIEPFFMSVAQWSPELSTWSVGALSEYDELSFASRIEVQSPDEAMRAAVDCLRSVIGRVGAKLDGDFMVAYGGPVGSDGS